MLNVADLAVIAITALVCTAVITGAALVALHINRRGSMAGQLGIVVASSVLSVVVSTVAISLEMYLSSHDLRVLLWVIGAAAAFSVIAAWFMLRIARKSLLQLSEAAVRIGLGEVVAARNDGAREFGELSLRLADASAKLASARAEVERLDSSRRQLVAWVSHDLRTPLAGMRAMAEALEAGVADNPAEYVRHIRDQVDSVNQLVEALFELSKIQSGTLKLNKQEVVLLDLVSDAVADLSAIAAARGISIRRAGDLDVILLADPRELTRVVANLLTNSLRYAPADSEILVSANRFDDRLVLSVLDQGPGVETQDLGRIFEMGWRGSSARTAEAGSSGGGIGLAIVRGIVEAHGGEVAAEKVPGGFRLDVTLPTSK